MAKFRIKHTQKVMAVDIYEIEAESEQEAIDKYCNELAGAIEPIDFWTREISANDAEEITCVG
jgi:hypothetical protein